MQNPDLAGWNDAHLRPLNPAPGLSPSPASPGRATQLESSASGRLLPPAPSRSESGRLQWGPELSAPTGWQPSAHVLELDDASFERQVLLSRLPVVVDFWAEHCVPCRRQEPALQQLGERHFGRLRVGRINVYRSPQTTKRYQIQGVPHLLIVRQGELIQELVGDHGLESLERVLTRLEII